MAAQVKCKFVCMQDGVTSAAAWKGLTNFKMEDFFVDQLPNYVCMHVAVYNWPRPLEKSMY